MKDFRYITGVRKFGFENILLTLLSLGTFGLKKKKKFQLCVILIEVLLPYLKRQLLFLQHSEFYMEISRTATYIRCQIGQGLF